MANDAQSIWLAAGVRTRFVGVDVPFAHRDRVRSNRPSSLKPDKRRPEMSSLRTNPCPGWGFGTIAISGLPYGAFPVRACRAPFLQIRRNRLPPQWTRNLSIASFIDLRVNSAGDRQQKSAVPPQLSQRGPARCGPRAAAPSVAPPCGSGQRLRNRDALGRPITRSMGTDGRGMPRPYES
jgi:hypothetical protein